MAKIQDKLYNRIIEGELLELTEEEKVKLGIGLIAQNGNTTQIGGNLEVNGLITGNEIAEKMSGYSGHNAISKFIIPSYVGVVKNGNKVTFAIAGKLNVPNGEDYNNFSQMGSYYIAIPSTLLSKIYPIGISEQPNAFDTKLVGAFKNFNEKVNINVLISKSTSYGGAIAFTFYGTQDTIVKDADYGFRVELTLLLSDNLAV